MSILVLERQRWYCICGSRDEGLVVKRLPVRYVRCGKYSMRHSGELAATNAGGILWLLEKRIPVKDTLSRVFCDPILRIMPYR